MKEFFIKNFFIDYFFHLYHMNVYPFMSRKMKKNADWFLDSLVGFLTLGRICHLWKFRAGMWIDPFGVPLLLHYWKYINNLLSFVYTSTPLTRWDIRVRRISDAWLINFPRTWGEQRTPNARGRIQFPLCSRKKLTNFGLWRTVCKSFVDCAAQVRSPVHTYSHLVCEPFASGSRTIRRARLYEALRYPVHFIHLKIW